METQEKDVRDIAQETARRKSEILDSEIAGTQTPWT